MKTKKKYGTVNTRKNIRQLTKGTSIKKPIQSEDAYAE